MKKNSVGTGAGSDPQSSGNLNLVWGSEDSFNRDLSNSNSISRSSASRKFESSTASTQTATVSETVEVLPIPAHDVSISDRIAGKGTFGEVRAGLLFGSTDIVVKIPERDRKFRSENSNSKLNELLILRRARHPNVVLFHGVTFLEDLPCLVLETVDGGNIGTFVRHRRSSGAFERDRQEIFNHEDPDPLLCEQKLLVDVARGMQYLHGQKCPIVHKDLKPENILVQKCEPARAKISDVGLGTYMQPDHVTADSRLASRSSRSTSDRFTAPEVIRDRQYSLAGDVFSFGRIAIFVVDVACALDNATNQVCLQEQGRQQFPADVLSAAEDCVQAIPLLRPSFGTVYKKLAKKKEKVPMAVGADAKGATPKEVMMMKTNVAAQIPEKPDAWPRFALKGSVGQKVAATIPKVTLVSL
jgi:serine/threonine protein kinase